MDYPWGNDVAGEIEDGMIMYSGQRAPLFNSCDHVFYGGCVSGHIHIAGQINILDKHNVVYNGFIPLGKYMVWDDALSDEYYTMIGLFVDGANCYNITTGNIGSGGYTVSVELVIAKLELLLESGGIDIKGNRCYFIDESVNTLSISFKEIT